MLALEVRIHGIKMARIFLVILAFLLGREIVVGPYATGSTCLWEKVSGTHALRGGAYPAVSPLVVCAVRIPIPKQAHGHTYTH